MFGCCTWKEVVVPPDPLTAPLNETNGFRDLVGIEPLEGPEPGTSHVVIREIRDELRQWRGFVHGGVYATIIDAALGEAVHSSLGEGGSAVTIELNMNLMRAVAEGGLAAYGRVIHATGSLVVATADVHDEEGNLVASGRGTFRAHRARNGRPDKEEP